MVQTTWNCNCRSFGNFIYFVGYIQCIFLQTNSDEHFFVVLDYYVMHNILLEKYFYVFLLQKKFYFSIGKE
jgi:hypothetical protein